MGPDPVLSTPDPVLSTPVLSTAVKPSRCSPLIICRSNTLKPPSLKTHYRLCVTLTRAEAVAVVQVLEVMTTQGLPKDGVAVLKRYAEDRDEYLTTSKPQLRKLLTTKQNNRLQHKINVMLTGQVTFPPQICRAWRV